MLPVKKILWPTDFSEPSYQALEAAVEIAGRYSAGLLILHVVTPLPVIAPHAVTPTGFDVVGYIKRLEEAAEARLTEIIKERIPDDVKARALVINGGPAEEIVRVADEREVDMIVIATRGTEGWHHLLFGSIAEKVVRLSPVPVLTIRKPEPQED